MEAECPDSLPSFFQTSAHISIAVKWLMRAFLVLLFVFALLLWLILGEPYYASLVIIQNLRDDSDFVGYQHRQLVCIDQ